MGLCNFPLIKEGMVDLMIWSGSVTTKANNTIYFYRIDKNDNITAVYNTVKIGKSANFSVSNVKCIKKNNVVYLKTCSNMMTALKAAAEASDAKKSVLKTLDDISNTVVYMKIDSNMSSSSVPSTGSSGTSSNMSIKSENGVLQIKGKTTITVWSEPGGYAAGTANINKGSGYIDIDFKNECYIVKNGKKYLCISSTLQASIKSATGATLKKGAWLLIDGSKAKISNEQSSLTGYKYSTTSDTSSTTTETEEEQPETNSATLDVESGANVTSLKTNSTLNDLMSKSMHGIFGMPYQWMEIADTRVDGTEFGRKYAEKIVARMPLLFLTPCRPAFLRGASKEQKNNIISTFADKGVKVSESLLSELLGDVEDAGISRYYTANFAYEEYYRYVNVCCQVTAKLLNLDGGKGSPTKNHGVKIGGKVVNDLSKYSWNKALKKGFTDYFSSASAIPFYINANVSVSESFGNDTMESSLAGTVKSKSEQGKELSFLLNSASAASNGGWVTNGVDAFTGLKDALKNNASAANFMTSVGNSMASIAAGGSMIFPELWSSSSMGRSYQIDIKLRSPDGDNLSVYLNILVPLYHLICLAAPQMNNNNYNIYYSPFLIKAYCKSMFNIDMGIITSMDITKGKEGDWNANGLPTSIDVSITIKDLYDIFSLTGYENKLDFKNPITDVLGIGKASGAKRIVRNTAMMDYLCNNAGLNLNQNEVARQITVYKMLRENNIINWPNNKWLEIQQWVDNKLAGYLKPGVFNKK